ncbi:type IV secretion system protein, partial [Patescibacteria group bacterium]|nr:type IV secretion system protein [Patescibacteria group bacterium]
ALLINFSGVLVGLFADLGNIIVSFFLERTTDAAWATNPWGGNPGTELGSNIVRILYFFLGTIILFITLLLFATRTVVLWLLSILAPLAFLASTLPATRGIWQRWWKNLIQWALVGVPMSFFLYLSGAMLAMDTGKISGYASGAAAEFVGAFFAPLASLAFLFLGVMLSTALAPEGSRLIMDWGKKTGLGAYKEGGKKGLSWTRSRMAESGTVQKAAQQLEQSTSRGGGWRAKTIGRPFMPFARAIGRTAGSKNLQALKAQSALAEADAAKMDEATVASLLKGTDPVEKKIGYINAKIKSGDIDDVRKAFGKDEFDAFLGRVYGQAEERGAHKDMQAAFSHLIPNLQIQRSIAAENLGIPISRVTYTQAAAVTPAEVLAERQSMLRGMRPDRVKQMSAGVFDHDDALDRMLTSWDGRHMGNFLTQHGQRGVDALERRLHALAPAPNTPRSWLTANNPGLLHYIDSQAGQQLGFTI